MSTSDVLMHSVTTCSPLPFPFLLRFNFFYYKFCHKITIKF